MEMRVGITLAIRSRPTQRLTVATFTVIALLTLSGAVGAFSLQPGNQPSSTTSSWWSSQFAYRKSITITNPLASALTNSPIFLLVNFPFSHLSDATAELRLVSSTGAEVPSYVLDEVSTNGFVTSAWVLVLASLPKSSSETLELYYGNTAATAPSYRMDAATAKAQSGDLSLDVSGSQPGSSSAQITFGNTYSEQILSKVAYSEGTPGGYGAAEISHSPLSVTSPLSLVANVSSSTVALSAVYSAGVLRYTQAYLLDNNTLVDARLLTNSGQTAVNGLSLTDLVDASSLAALGLLNTSYAQASSLLSTEVSGAYFGYASNSTASSFEVGDRARVISDASNGALSNSTFGAETAAGLRWNLGSLPPGGSTPLISVWGVGRTYSELASSVGADIGQLQTSVGQEEVYPAALSQVTSSWDVAIPITNASVSSGGLSIPISLKGATPVASRINLAGTVSYVLPSGYASSSSMVGWTPESAATGNVSVYATTAFYSIQERSYSDSVRVTSGTGAGSGAAQLVSPVLSFPSSVSKSLVLKYKAAFSGGGDFSSQWLYVAVDDSQTPTGPFTQTLSVPAGGSSASISGSGCESLTPKGVAAVSTETHNVTSSGALVADGSWRNLNVSLDDAFGISSQYARIRFCVATASGFTGQLELDVASAGIEARGNAPSFLSASASQGGGALTLSYISGATYEPSSLTLNGVISFPAVENTPLTWDGGTSYKGTIQGLLSGVQAGPPVDQGRNGTASINSTRTANTPTNATFIGASITPPPYHSALEILVNGSAVNGVTIGNAVFLNSSDIIGNGASTFSAVDITLTFAGHVLGMKVEDADGNPLSGAMITIQANGSAPMNASATDSTGSLSLTLLPSTYTVTADFHGVDVGSATANLTSDQAIIVPTSVYSIPLQVKNAIGGTVEGANITISSGPSSFAVTSGHNGIASFLAVPSRQYNISVSIAGSAYYAGTIVSSPSRATFELGTSYLPASIQIAIVGAIAAAMLAASLVVYLARRRPKAS
jgi:hypothetical protein